MFKKLLLCTLLGSFGAQALAGGMTPAARRAESRMSSVSDNILKADKKTILKTIREYKLHRIALGLALAAGASVVEPKNLSLTKSMLISSGTGAALGALFPSKTYSESAAKGMMMSARWMLSTRTTPSSYNVASGLGFALGDSAMSSIGRYADKVLDAQIAKAEASEKAQP